MTMEPIVMVNAARTIMVTIWPGRDPNMPATMTVAMRHHSSHTWGPPITMQPADKGEVVTESLTFR